MFAHVDLQTLKGLALFTHSFHNYSKCLKSHQKCLGFSYYTNVSDFRHILTKHVSGNRTVIECLKSILVRISDTYCLLCYVKVEASS